MIGEKASNHHQSVVTSPFGQPRLATASPARFTFDCVFDRFDLFCEDNFSFSSFVSSALLVIYFLSLSSNSHGRRVVLAVNLPKTCSKVPPIRHNDSKLISNDRFDLFNLGVLRSLENFAGRNSHLQAIQIWKALRI